MKRTFLLFLLFAVWIISNAQADLNNRGILHISSVSDTFFINGHFRNEATAAFINNGRFYVRRDLTNDQPSVAVGSGTLNLNGSLSQSINGSQGFKTNNLVTDNNAGIILNNDLSVSGIHTFSNGIISTSVNPNYLIYEAGSSYNGSSDNNHVNGWIRKNGNTDFLFPVGNVLYERPILVSSLSSNSSFNVKYNAVTPNTSQKQAPLVSIDPNEYWSVNKLSGGSASVTMNWDQSKVAMPNWTILEISSASYNGSLWTDIGGNATGNVATTGSVTSDSVSGFDRFTFASRSYPVPLTMLSFTGQRLENYTQLQWITDNEHSVSHYILERSDNRLYYYKIGLIPAHNRSNQETYFKRDSLALDGVAYYRLRCVDMDGREKLSSVVKVSSTGQQGNIKLLTNPVHEHLILVANDQKKGTFTYSIISLNGQIIQTGQIEIIENMQIKIPVGQNFAKGTYVLELRNISNLSRFLFILK